MILLVTTDLMIQSRVSIAAQAGNLELRVVDSCDSAIEHLAAYHPQLLLIDLQTRGLDFDRLINESRNQEQIPHTVAFAQHVQIGLLEAARRAIGTQVMTRGEFCRQIPKIVAEKT